MVRVHTAAEAVQAPCTLPLGRECRSSVVHTPGISAPYENLPQGSQPAHFQMVQITANEPEKPTWNKQQGEP